MNSNDARSAVMAPLFGGDGTQPAFSADYRNRENGMIFKMNEKESKESEAMDFSHADAVDTAVLNQLLWQDRMGDKPMPESRHSIFPATREATVSGKAKGKDLD